MNSHEKFRREFLTDAALPYRGDERHYQSRQLAIRHGIDHKYVREILLELADDRFIRLRAFDGQQVREWNQWPDPDDMFFNPDSDYIRVKILAAGAALVEDLPERSFGFPTTSA
jgi:hypothetical protein